MEGVFNKIEILLMLIQIIVSRFKLTLQLLQNSIKSSVSEVLLHRWVTCSEFWEVDEFCIRYPQSSYFVLEGSGYLQHVTWS